MRHSGPVYVRSFALDAGAVQVLLAICLPACTCMFLCHTTGLGRLQASATSWYGLRVPSTSALPSAPPMSWDALGARSTLGCVPQLMLASSADHVSTYSLEAPVPSTPADAASENVDLLMEVRSLARSHGYSTNTRCVVTARNPVCMFGCNCAAGIFEPETSAKACQSGKPVCIGKRCKGDCPRSRAYEHMYVVLQADQSGSAAGLRWTCTHGCSRPVCCNVPNGVHHLAGRIRATTDGHGACPAVQHMRRHHVKHPSRRRSASAPLGTGSPGVVAAGPARHCRASPWLRSQRRPPIFRGASCV